MDDDDFIRAFETHALLAQDWTHRAHIRVAWIFLTRLGYESALPRVRIGIQAHNREVMKIVDELERGYHETVTVAWLRLVDAHIRSQQAFQESEAFCDANPHLMNRTLLRCFYSRGRLISWEAKRQFVDGDLAMLPALRLAAPD